MDAAGLKAWREGLKLIRKDAAVLLGISPATLASYEGNRRPIPSQLDERISALQSGEALPEPTKRAPKAKAVNPEDEVADRRPRWSKYTPEPIDACLKRKPLYAETSVEAGMMRDALAERANVYRSTVPMIPLRPTWRKAGNRPVNAEIPFPLDIPAPERFGWRAVQTASGTIYDYETAHVMRLA